MVDHLGITDRVKSKIILVDEPGRAPLNVAEGKAEMVITLISEILPVPGVELLGPLPPELQNYISFAAAVSTKAANPEAAKAMIKFMTGPAVAQTLKAKGMEPR